MTFQAGDKVRVRPPFQQFSGDVYTIAEVSVAEDGQTVYMIAEPGLAFDAKFLEIAQ